MKTHNQFIFGAIVAIILGIGVYLNYPRKQYSEIVTATDQMKHRFYHESTIITIPDDISWSEWPTAEACYINDSLKQFIIPIPVDTISGCMIARATRYEDKNLVCSVIRYRLK
jgi:hypothetical protein